MMSVKSTCRWNMTIICIMVLVQTLISWLLLLKHTSIVLTSSETNKTNRIGGKLNKTMNTLFDKIWDKHVVQIVEDGPTQLYIDRLYCHEVTSPQAFWRVCGRNLKCFRPKQIFCMPDHNTADTRSGQTDCGSDFQKQVDVLAQNCKEDFGCHSLW